MQQIGLNVHVLVTKEGQPFSTVGTTSPTLEPSQITPADQDPNGRRKRIFRRNVSPTRREQQGVNRLLPGDSGRGDKGPPNLPVEGGSIGDNEPEANRTKITPEILYSQLHDSDSHQPEVISRMRKILAYFTRENLENPEDLQPQDITRFLASPVGKNIVTFQEDAREMLDGIEIQDGGQKRKEYEKALHEFGKIIFRTRWERIPSKPSLGRNPNYWHFMSEDWRLTREGLDAIPPIGHERHDFDLIKTFPKNQRREMEEHMEGLPFDGGGRPVVGWGATTRYGKEIGADFERGAAQRASEREENMITLDEYGRFRDRIGKLHEGLLLFSFYAQQASPEEQLALMRIATGGNIPNELFSREVMEYATQFLPAFGMYKYLRESGGLTVYFESEGEEGGHRVINADDILEQWLLREEQFPDQVRLQGRQILSVIMRHFEAGSPHDVDWIGPNEDIMHLFESEAVSARRDFSGRYGFGSVSGAIREGMLKNMRKGRHTLINPWRNRLGRS